MMESIRQRLDKIADNAGYATSAGVGTVRETIREKPLTSVVVGVALGFAVGLGMRRGVGRRGVPGVAPHHPPVSAMIGRH
jgi:ElaB/YqjD/DUF883 family membrane-anchored ribosome-binding protein